LWIGTNDKGLVAYKNGTFTVYGKAEGAPSNIIRAITEDSNGVIYCGTSDGIFSIDSDEVITPIPLDTAKRQFVTSVCFDENDNLYAVFDSDELFMLTNSGETVEFDRGEMQPYSVNAVSGGRTVEILSTLNVATCGEVSYE
jgi:ligand-binding sensor domain-containing protein